MMLCYSCFFKIFGNTKRWELISCDTTIRKRCEKCDLVGFYIRDVAESTDRGGGD